MSCVHTRGGAIEYVQKYFAGNSAHVIRTILTAPPFARTIIVRRVPLWFSFELEVSTIAKVYHCRFVKGRWDLCEPTTRRLKTSSWFPEKTNPKVVFLGLSVWGHCSYFPFDSRCTREQTAFLSSSRAARFSSAPQDYITTITTGNGQESPESFPEPPFSSHDSNEATSRGADVDAVLAHHVPGRQGWVGRETGRDAGLGALGIGMSSTVLEELDKIEKACSQRSSALKEEEPFVESLGKVESPVAV